MNDLLAWVLGMVDSVDPIMRTVLAGIGVMLETSVLVGLIIPGDSIVIVASLATENPFVNPVQFTALVLTVIVGSLIGESIGFALGRYFGPKIRRSALGRRIGEDHWMRAENYLDRRGGIAVFVSRFLPVLHSLVPLTVGMSTMSYRKFMTWTIPACTIWALAYVSVGTTAGGVTRQLIADQLHYAGYVFVGIIVVFAVIVMAVKWVLGRSQRRHMLRRGDGDANTLETAD